MKADLYFWLNSGCSGESLCLRNNFFSSCSQLIEVYMVASNKDIHLYTFLHLKYCLGRSYICCRDLVRKSIHKTFKKRIYLFERQNYREWVGKCGREKEREGEKYLSFADCPVNATSWDWVRAKPGGCNSIWISCSLALAHLQLLSQVHQQRSR